MSKTKINENQFLGKAELNRLQLFLEENGYKRNMLLNSSSFGLFEDFQIPEVGQVFKEDCLYVRKAGTPFDEFVLQKGVAIDLNGNIILNNSDKNFKVSNDGAWYWVKAKHEYSTKEKGTVSIDALGNLTGTGTAFQEILRSQPNFPTKIKLHKSVNGNTQEYEVVKVINDTNCVLFGDFNAETNLEFSVIGTFTPGFPVPTNYKEIYQFDSIKVEIIQETQLATPPAYLMGQEFYLARVRNNGVDLTIQDKRIDWYRTNFGAQISNVDRVTDNTVIGVEAVKYNLSSSTKDSNIVDLAFGFRFNSYTIDTNSKKISILIGNGGRYKTTSNFETGKFNGWRLYRKNGSYSDIIDSQKSGSQIVLTLDILNPDDFGATDNLFVAPPYEDIEIKCEIIGLQDTLKIFHFPINTPLCKFQLNSFDGCVMYNFAYRYKNHFGYTDWKQFPNDTVGHYTETSFLANGNLKPILEDRTQLPYTGSLTEGFIKICESPNSYDNFQNLIDTGDLFGVNTSQLTNQVPVVELHVGTSKKYQHFTESLTLSADIYIHLNSKKIDGASLREGNEFFLHFEQFINLDNFKLRIVSNYLNPESYDLVAELDANDMAFIKNNVSKDGKKRGLFATCTFNDLGKWICHYETDTNVKGTVKMISSVLSGAFVNNAGASTGYWGWRLMTEMNEAFPRGTNNILNTGTNPLGATGGSTNFTIGINNMPAHDHYTVKGAYAAQASAITLFKDRTVLSYTQDVWNGQIAVQDAFDVCLGSTTDPADAGKSSKTGGGEAINFAPKYKNFIYLEKIV